MRGSMYRLADVGDALAAEGIILEESLFSHWQKNKRIPQDRQLLLILLKIFVSRGGVTSIEEANELLESAKQGFLTHKETKKLQFSAPRGLFYFANTKEQLKKILHGSTLKKSANIVFCFSCGVHKEGEASLKVV